MERLTVRVPESEETYLSCEKCGKKAFSECWDEMDCKQTVIDRLAAIEDILGDDYDLYRLRELVQSDRDGRCVVLLSNDDVYTIRGDIVNGIIKANCRDACKPPKSALKGDQHG